MLTAKAEAAQRLTLPFASPKDKPVDDIFGDLLRQLGEAAETARPGPSKSPEDAGARRADDTAPPERRTRSAKAEDQLPVRDAAADADTDPATAAHSDPAKSPDSTGRASSTADAQDGTSSASGSEAQTTASLPTNTGPAVEGAALQDNIPPLVDGAAPIAVPPAGPAGIPAVSQTAEAKPAASPAPDAPTHPEPAPAPIADGAPADPTAPSPAPNPNTLAATGQAPAPATGEPAQPAAIAADPTGTDPARQAMGNAGSATDPIAEFPEHAAAPVGGGGRDVAVQVERPSVPILAQGLGKLGTGAEVALAAQAIGDEMQSTAPGQVRKAGSATPQGPVVPPPASQPGNGAPTPVAGVPNTPAQAAANLAARPTATAIDRPVEPGSVTTGRFENALDPVGGLTTAGPGTTGTTSAGHAAAAQRAVGLPSPAEQLAVQIQRAAGDGTSRITVQLRPAELGSIEVQLDFAQDGRVSASILADRPETLDLLQRDARLLERSLQDAGLKTDSGSLSFDLRGGGRQDQGAPQTAGRTAPEKIGGESNLATGSEPAAREATTAATDGAVDIRV